MSPTINFPNVVLNSGGRPYADVVLLLGAAATNPPVTHKCLVDSGADLLQLPASAAAPHLVAGIAPTPISTAGASTNMIRVNGLTVSVEGWQVVVDVLFDPTNTSHLIAGRKLLLAAFQFGIRIGDWLYT